MEVRLETTEGFGGQAEVWVDGALLTVRDGVSRPDDRLSPGVLEDVHFSYTTDEALSWDDAAKANTGHFRRLDPVRGWSYVGFGRVVSIRPVEIDFGLLQMEDANWSNDAGLVGRYVKVLITRLEMSVAESPEQPE